MAPHPLLKYHFSSDLGNFKIKVHFFAKINLHKWKNTFIILRNSSKWIIFCTSDKIELFAAGLNISLRMLHPLYTINRRGSIITCHVQKHRTEIIEVEVWLNFITISKSDGAKTKTVMYKMDVNVHYVERNTSLGVF